MSDNEVTPVDLDVLRAEVKYLNEHGDTDSFVDAQATLIEALEAALVARKQVGREAAAKALYEHDVWKMPQMASVMMPPWSLDNLGAIDYLNVADAILSLPDSPLIADKDVVAQALFEIEKSEGGYWGVQEWHFEHTRKAFLEKADALFASNVLQSRGEVAAKALENAADELDPLFSEDQIAWLRARAARLRQFPTQEAGA